MGKKVSIVVECDDCSGRGLFSYMCEGEERNVVCTGCGGRAAVKLTFNAYTGRKKKRGVKEINMPKGHSISGCGIIVVPMTYKEFEKNFPPAPVVPLNFST